MKQGDPESVRELWDRYLRRVTGLAKRRLAGDVKRVVDEDDVAQSVFRSLCLGAADGEFPELQDRNDLWPLLAKITNRKAINQLRRANRKKRGGGEVRGESVLQQNREGPSVGFDEIASDAESPEMNAQLTEECDRLLAALPDDTYRFVIWKRLEGHSNDEIADLLGVTTRSVERKIQNARDVLARKLESTRNDESS